MKDILELIVKNLVEFPNDVNITEDQDEKGKILKVKVNSQDMGRVIGKQGKIARSIRSLMKSIASKEKQKVIVEFED